MEVGGKLLHSVARVHRMLPITKLALSVEFVDNMDHDMDADRHIGFKATFIEVGTRVQVKIPSEN